MRTNSKTRLSLMAACALSAMVSGATAQEAAQPGAPEPDKAKEARMRTLPASLGGKDGIPLIKVEFETTLAKDGSTRATAYHKSNKIITAGGRIFVGWLDVGNNSCVASCDLKTKTWSQTVILGDGQDNHAGPALAIDSQGFLYAMFGPHWAQPFRFRKSLKPYDASEWTPAAKLYPEWNCSYPSMVFDAQDMLHLAFRGFQGQAGGVTRLPQSLYVRLGADGAWTSPREMVCAAPKDYTAQHPYAQYNENLAVGKDGTLHYAFYLYGDHPAKGTHQGVGYMRSRDGGQTWQALDGTKLDLPVLRESPAVFLRPPVDAAGKQDPVWKINEGNVALDPDGNPWIYTFGRLWCGEGGTWRAIDLKPILQRDFPGKIADSGNTLGNVVFDKDGTLYVSCEIEDPPGAWGAPGTQVVLLVSGDRGKTFASLPVSGLDPKVACWFSSLERPTGPRLLDGPPNLIYMRGEPGKKMTGGPASEVVFVRLAK
jgi:hypothetical protein